MAVRYQDLQAIKGVGEQTLAGIRNAAIGAVIERAHRTVGRVMRPEWTRVIAKATTEAPDGNAELAIFETIEARLAGEMDQLHFELRTPRDRELAILMDASLSMRGEKLALLAVAVAVVALNLPMEHLRVAAFNSEARTIKDFGSIYSIPQLIRKILEFSAIGFTNLEKGLLDTIDSLDAPAGRRAKCILISDGKYTEGRDPAYLADRFRCLHVLKVGRDQAGLKLLTELCAASEGTIFSAATAEELPESMYSALKKIFR
jgi:hypothetical protein